EALQILYEGQGETLEGRVLEQDLEGKDRALLVDELVVLHAPAGLAEQLQRDGEIGAQIARSVGLGRLILGGKKLGRQLAAIGLEQSQLLLRRQPLGLELGFGEVAARAIVD